jgi:hypothetical protein
MFPLSARWRATFVLALVILVSPSIATAGPILISFDVTLSQPGPVVDFDDDVLVTNGVEIDNASGTNVGAPLVFFPDEFIDVTSDLSSTSLAYMLQGGGGVHPTAAGYQTSWPFGTAILFSDFVLDQPGTLASVSVTVDEAGGLARVVGAGGGPLLEGVDYFVNPNSLQLQLFGLGILDQADQTPLGLMTFQLNFVADDPIDPPVPVSEPASLTVIGMAIAAIGARRRFARPRQ